MAGGDIAAPGRRRGCSAFRAPPGPRPAAAAIDPDGHTQTFEVAGHALVTAAPAVTYAGAPRAFAAPRPWGEDEPAWLPA